jgi:hypothetical protein
LKIAIAQVVPNLEFIGVLCGEDIRITIVIEVSDGNAVTFGITKTLV